MLGVGWVRVGKGRRMGELGRVREYSTVCMCGFGLVVAEV